MLITDDPVNAFVAYEPVAVSSDSSGALADLTFAVKDVYDVAGYPTGCGNPTKQSESPIHARNAAAVQRLLDAGARFVGKTQTDELAFSLNGQNKHFRQPINPRARNRITGGSSSGSAAAVGAGLCDFALGTDTGGSIRAPASYCGLWGLRPTHGRVPLEGVMPLAPSLDVAGFLADSAAVFSRVAPVFLGPDTADLRLHRLIVADDGFAQRLGHAEARAFVPAEAAIASRFECVRYDVVAPEGLEAWREVCHIVQACEAWGVHGGWITDRHPNMAPEIRERFEAGRDLSAGAFAEASAKRATIQRRLESLLGNDAVLVLPTVPSIAPLRDAPADELQAFRKRAHRLLCIAGLTGMPQITLPLATLCNCPLGVSLIGPRGADLALVDIAVTIATGCCRPNKDTAATFGR